MKEGLRLTRKFAFRFRAQLWPLYLLAGGLMAGYVVSRQGAGAGVLVALGGCAVAAWRLRRAFKRSNVAAKAGTCMALATAWLVAASVLGFPAVDWVAVVLWLLPAILWWSSHGVRPARPVAVGAPIPLPVEDGPGLTLVPPLEQSEEPDTSEEPDAPVTSVVARDVSTVVFDNGGLLSEVQQRWNTRLRDKRSLLRDVEISVPTPFAYGDSYVLQLPPGERHLGEVLSELPYIESGLEHPIENLLIEKHPDFNNPTVLRLQYIKQSPIKETVYFKEPTVIGGRIRLGPYGDGVGHASYRLYTENRIHGGFLLGSTNSGKSRTMELIALAALWTGNTIVIYIDGQNGASSPLLYREATWAGGPAEAPAMLEAIERGMARRQQYNRVYELGGFDPSREYPGILIIIDECHRIFNDKNGERYGNVSREGGKLGMGELAASQYSGLKGTFGDSDALRSSLLAGNGLALRTSSKVSAQMIPGLDFNPAKLPAIPGYGWVVAPPEDEHARSAPYRAEYIPDERDRTKKPDLAVPVIGEWFEQARSERWEPELDQMTAHAFGPEFVNRHEIAAQRRAALVASFESGAPMEAPPLLRALDGGALPSAAPTSAPEAPRRCADAILALPWESYDCVMRRREIIAELPDEFRTPSTVASALNTLVASGALSLESKGTYRRERAPSSP